MVVSTTHTHSINCTHTHPQIHDYYVVMRENNRMKSMESLYLLFAACYMLRSVKIQGLPKSHDYPKMQLAHMLMLEYWRSSGHVVWDMMEGNMSMFDEEWGEILFGILSRCVLGDHIKSSFQHMCDIYKLLPVYRSIRNEIMKDHDNSKHSLNWHHKIPVDAEEVTATAFFFKQMIRQIYANKYESYEVKAGGYKWPDVLKGRGMYNVPQVYNPNVADELAPVFGNIKNNLQGFFLYPHQRAWPEAKTAYDVGDMDVELQAQQIDDVKIPEAERVYGSPWVQCIENRFAVTRDHSEADGTMGICVYKIVKRLNAFRENGLLMNTFIGREYICTVGNHTLACVKQGSWNHYPQLSKEIVVNNWNVISYFPLFIKGKKLPASAVSDIELDGERDAVFAEVDD